MWRSGGQRSCAPLAHRRRRDWSGCLMISTGMAPPLLPYLHGIAASRNFQSESFLGLLGQNLAGTDTLGGRCIRVGPS
jgi:hypothetical protein